MGTFKFRCVFCRQKIEAEDEWDGMFAECPGCGRRIEVRRDDEFALKPPHTRLAPIPPAADLSPPPPPRPTFQKQFPPKMPHTPLPKPQAPPVEKTAVDEEPPAKMEPPAPEAPKPFPKPFAINLPKWELPKKDGAKK